MGVTRLPILEASLNSYGRDKYVKSVLMKEKPMKLTEHVGEIPRNFPTLRLARATQHT
jgi:hypothetical protein